MAIVAEVRTRSDALPAALNIIAIGCLRSDASTREKHARRLASVARRAAGRSRFRHACTKGVDEFRRCRRHMCIRIRRRSPG